MSMEAAGCSLQLLEVAVYLYNPISCCRHVVEESCLGRILILGSVWRKLTEILTRLQRHAPKKLVNRLDVEKQLHGLIDGLDSDIVRFLGGNSEVGMPVERV